MTDTIIAAALDALTALQESAQAGEHTARVIIDWNGHDAYRETALRDEAPARIAKPARK